MLSDKKFPHCLKVFCDQTVTAIKTHLSINKEDTAETV